MRRKYKSINTLDEVVTSISNIHDVPFASFNICRAQCSNIRYLDAQWADFLFTCLGLQHVPSFRNIGTCRVRSLRDLLGLGLFQEWHRRIHEPQQRIEAGDANQELPR